MAFLGKTVFVVFFCLALMFGCNEAQRLQTDKIIADVNTITSGAKTILESPAGGLLPAEWKLIALLAAGLISAGTNVWQKWRQGQLTTVTKSIVQGIEALETTDSAAGAAAKDNIAVAMKANEIYPAGKIIVTELKNA
jgi:hypothetical protein